MGATVRSPPARGRASRRWGTLTASPWQP